MYLYQETPRFFAQVAGALEEEGAAELAELGARGVKTSYRGVYFNADAPTLYRINYQSRLLTRVLAPLTAFHCHNPDYLYRTLKTLDWYDFLTVDDTFAVFASVSNSKIRHSKYAALRVKDAIADAFRDATGQRPSVDTRQPDVWFNLHIDNNHATLSVDTSGGSLHRRGYREASVTAPIQETVAAAAVRLSGWEGEVPLYDPFCGSGTLLAEALMHYCRIPAASLRSRFGFEQLPDFDPAAWAAVKQAADDAIRPLPEGLLAGSDRDHEAVAAARQNLANLPHGDGVSLKVSDFEKLSGFANTTLLTNPPYGQRIGNRETIGTLYKALGDFLKQRCTGSTAYIYVGKPALLKQVGLRTTWKKPLVNGAMEGRLARYDLY